MKWAFWLQLGTHSRESKQKGLCRPGGCLWTQLENYSPDSCPWESNLRNVRNNRVTIQLAAPPPEFLVQEVWEGAPD